MIIATFLILVFTSVLITQILPSITLPTNFINSVYWFYQKALYLDGILPVFAVFDCLWVIVFVIVAKTIFNLVIGFLALLGGSGKPEI